MLSIDNKGDFKIGEILERMSNNKYTETSKDEYFTPKNPFNNNSLDDIKPNIDRTMESLDNSKDADILRNDLAKFHKMMKNNVEKTELEIEECSQKLLIAASSGDYKTCFDLTLNPRFVDFVNIKDENGFTAVNYSTTYGYKQISKLLIDNGADVDDKCINDFINLGDIDSELLKQTSQNLIEDEEYDNVVYKPEESIRNSILNAKIINSNVLNDVDKVDRIMGIADSIERHNDFESNFCRNIKKNVVSSKNEIKKTVVSKSSAAKKNKTDNSFTAAFRKNFIKNGFSEERNSEKIEIPKREETTVEQMEEILKKFEEYKEKEESYAAINNKFVEQFSGRNVSLLMIQKEKIDSIILEHRLKMLPETIIKSNLHNMVKNVLKQQIKSLSNKIIENISNSLFDTIIFYRDMFERLLNFNKAHVASSKIHGNGLFASTKLKRGDIITFYFPYFLEYTYYDKENNEEAFVILPICSRRKFDNNMQELDILRKDTIKINENMMMVGDNEYISDERFIAHMVNDPCDFSSNNITAAKYEIEIKKKSNASLISYDKDRRFIYLVATKDIEKDTEILVPYGHRYWEISE